MTSKNNLFISVAVVSSNSLLVINIPPKALTRSPANAAFQASVKLLREAIPQALLCFKIAKVVSVNSAIKFTAASTSNKLLYDNSLPFNCVNNSSKLP